MNHIENNPPPRWVLAFFRWFCHPEIKESIEGDLLELYHHRIAGLGLAKARWLLIKDVLMLLRPGIIMNPHGQVQPFNMMKHIHWTKLIIINLLVALMILSPFIPGPSNKIVLALSVSAQAMGYLGLALVPLGLAWLVIQMKRSRKVDFTDEDKKTHDRIAIAASLLIALIFLCLALYLPHTMPKISFFIALILILAGLLASSRYGAIVILAVTATACLTFTLLILTLAVFVGVGIFQGILAISLAAGGIIWLIKSIGAMKNNSVMKFRQLPVYLVTIPVMSFLISTLVMRPASNFSRNYAIERSQALISSIEDYKNKEGKYPESIETLKVPGPNIMGIDRFRYTSANDSYSLSFSQWLDWGSLEEIVLYDKNNLKDLYGKFSGYDYKVDLSRVHGAMAQYNTKHANWQYYHCD